MTRTSPTLLVLLLAMVSVPVAEAGPIIYFDSYRSLKVDGTLFETTATGFWSATASLSPTRIQRSHIGELRVDPAGHPYESIRASASLVVIRPTEPTSMSTDLFTSFLLDSPYTADLDAFVSARLDGFAEGFLFNESTQTMLAQAMVEHGTMRLQYDGILAPGIYSYYLAAQLSTPAGLNDHNAQFGGDFNLTPFTPVPEPGSMTLLGIGLAAAAWRRRRQQ